MPSRHRLIIYIATRYSDVDCAIIHTPHNCNIFQEIIPGTRIIGISKYLCYELGEAANVYKNISDYFSIPWDYNLVAKSCRITGELLKGPVTANIFLIRIEHIS